MGLWRVKHLEALIIDTYQPIYVEETEPGTTPVIQLHMQPMQPL